MAEVAWLPRGPRSEWPRLGSRALIIHLIIQTIRRDPTGSDQIDEASNVSSPDPSGAGPDRRRAPGYGSGGGGSSPCGAYHASGSARLLVLALALVLVRFVVAVAELVAAVFAVLVRLASTLVGSVGRLDALAAGGGTALRLTSGAGRMGGWGWLLGGWAANTAARSRPAAPTGLGDSACSTIRAKPTPSMAPSSAPMTTRSWPSWRNERSTKPPTSSGPCLGCRRRARSNPTKPDQSWQRGRCTDLAATPGALRAA
jgi:hypothetical protein